MTVNFSRIVKFAAAISVIFFLPHLPSRFSTRIVSLWGLSDGFYIYYLTRAHRVGTENDPGRDDRGAKTHPLVVPHNFFPLGSLHPLPEIASTRVLHPPLLAGEVATDASALFVLSLSFSLFLSISRPDFFFCTKLAGIPPRRLGKGPCWPRPVN